MAAVANAYTAPSVGQFLIAEYPDARQRAYAIRWLGWIACQQDAGDDIRWWAMPNRVSGQIRTILTLAVCGLIACTLGAIVAIRPEAFTALPEIPQNVTRMLLLAMFALAATQVSKVWSGPFPRCVPRTFTWRRPWGEPEANLADGTPRSVYRTDRLAGPLSGLMAVPLVLGFLWLGGLLTGILALDLSPLSFFGWDPLYLVYAIVAWICVSSMSGAYPLLKLAEFALWLGWGERVRFLRLLEDAADRGVLRRDGAGYAFRDEDTRDTLAAAGEEFIAGHERELARKARRSVIRTRIVDLNRKTADRFAKDVGFGTMIFGAAGSAMFLAANGNPGWVVAILAVLVGGATYVVGGAAAFLTLDMTVGFARWTLANVALSRRRRLIVALVAVLAVGVLIAEAGTDLARFGAFILPAVCVMACGWWACAVALRVTRRRKRVLDRVPDVITIATAAAGLLVLCDSGLLTRQPAAGLLLPVAAWGSVRVSRAMGRSKRRVVKAAADITLSLLLGAVLVLFLVWLANVLDLPVRNVAELRDWLESAREHVDFPWWSWAALYAVFVASDLAFLRWPGRLRKTGEWFKRLRLVGAADISERVLGTIHTGLLTIVFVGVSVPVTVFPTFHHQLKAAYTTAFQRELEAEGEAAAYSRIQRYFETGRVPGIIFADIVTDVHRDAASRGARPSRAEDQLAHSLGELQARTLVLEPEPRAATIASDAARQALDSHATSAAGLGQQASEVQKLQRGEEEASERAHQAAELATKILSGLISIPHVSDNEVVEVVTEYLSGLIEDSPLKDVFAAWAGRVHRAEQPPDARALVVPDPARLTQTAASTLESTARRTGGTAHATREDGNPVKAAVDMLDQAQKMTQNGSSSSSSHGRSNDEQGLHGDAHVGEP